MRLPLRFLAVLCALSTGAAFAQTAESAATSPVKKAPGISFSYDAQHDQVVANGVQLKTSAIGAAVSIPPTTGTVVVTLNITAISHFKHGTTYHCSVIAVGGELDTNNSVISGGLDTASGLAHWTGSNTLSCTLTIPYSWAVIHDPATTPGAVLAFAVAAVAPDGGGVQRSTLQADGVEPLPPNGATSTFTFAVTL